MSNFFGGQFFGGGFFGAIEIAQPRGNAGYGIYPHPPSKEEIQRSRERFGIKEAAAEVVEDVAARISQDRAEADEAERKAMLRRELQIKRVAFRTKYMEALELRLREMLEEERAAQREQQLKQQQEALLLMFMAAAVAA